MALLHISLLFVITQKYVFGTNTTHTSYELPCKKMDANFNDCINYQLETGIRNLAHGNPHLGVVQLDPLMIKAVRLEHTEGSLDIDQQFGNITVTGFTKSEISKTHFDIDNKTCQLYFESVTPSLISESIFRISGHFYIVPILAEGPATVTIKNLKGVHNMTCMRYKKKGVEHLRFLNYDIDVIPESVVYKFENILDENSQLNTEVHNLINSNSLTIFKQGAGPTEQAYEDIFRAIANKLLSMIPLSTLVEE